MSQAFFVDLAMPRPDVHLEVGSGSHAEQTARIMIGFENVCIGQRPDLVIVVGDVNSTMACAITAKKLGIAVAHVEAGLRSRDMTMPEEINRLCTDVISDHLFTTDEHANANLYAEGVAPEKVYFVGNVMIDTLLRHKQAASRLDLTAQWGLEAGRYATLTLHRPSNVDDAAALHRLLECLSKLAREIPIIFPIHPRTRKIVERCGLIKHCSTTERPLGLWLTEPLSYLELLHLNMHARMVLTDSGGLQEETTVLGIPCITLRENTERPITCDIGTNVLVGNSPERILQEAHKVLRGGGRCASIPEKWDGRAAERIVDILRGLGDGRPATVAQVIGMQVASSRRS